MVLLAMAERKLCPTKFISTQIKDMVLVVGGLSLPALDGYCVRMLDSCTTGDKSIRKLLQTMLAPDKLATTLVELAVLIDIGEPLAFACYKLEGDGPLALYAHELWAVAANFSMRY